MDGQADIGYAVTQEETEAMFTKITSVLDYLRNQLVNNTELAKQVQSLQAQVSELTSQIHSVVGQNTALQEAVNVLTRERDEAQVLVDNLRKEGADLLDKFNQRDNDANHWYSQYQAVSEELEKVKAERSKLEEDHQALVEEHERVKAKLTQIQSVFSTEMATPAELEIRKQPRDPATQQWASWAERQTG